MKKILLHVCCAPCASSCVERLLTETSGMVQLYFSNSNLDTAEEFARRLAAVEQLAGHYRLPLAVDPYDHADWLETACRWSDCPEGGERCRHCFRRVLTRSAGAMTQYGCDAFTTTLTVSPHKHAPTIFALGGEFPGFEAWDFKKRDGFRRSLELARELGFYRQSYCGCEFSRSARPD